MPLLTSLTWPPPPRRPPWETLPSSRRRGVDTKQICQQRDEQIDQQALVIGACRPHVGGPLKRRHYRCHYGIHWLSASANQQCNVAAHSLRVADMYAYAPTGPRQQAHPRQTPWSKQCVIRLIIGSDKIAAERTRLNKIGWKRQK